MLLKETYAFNNVNGGIEMTKSIKRKLTRMLAVLMVVGVISGVSAEVKAYSITKSLAAGGVAKEYVRDYLSNVSGGSGGYIRVNLTNTTPNKVSTSYPIYFHFEGVSGQYFTSWR